MIKMQIKDEKNKKVFATFVHRYSKLFGTVAAVAATEAQKTALKPNQTLINVNYAIGCWMSIGCILISSGSCETLQNKKT